MGKWTVILLCFLITGCASPGNSSWHLISPSTWFSHAPANKVDSAKQEVDENKVKSRKEVQKLVYQASESLALLPNKEDRPLALASDFLKSAELLLAQSEGPLTLPETTQLKQQIANLTSENAEIREKAEKNYSDHTKQIGELSEQLSDSQKYLNKAQGDLRQAFDRENSLANELRYHRSMFWVAVALAITAILGWGYLRLTIGGMPTAVGGLLSKLDSTEPEIANRIRESLDSFLNRGEQKIIRSEYIKFKHGQS